MHYERAITGTSAPSSIWWIGAACLVAGCALVVVASQTSPLMGFMGICGLLLSIALFRFPTLAFLLAAAVIPLERIGRLTSDSSMYTVSVMRIVGLLALASFLLHAVFRKWKINFGLAFILYTVFCIWGLCSVTWTTDYFGGVRAG